VDLTSHLPHERRLDAVQAALVQEVAGRRPALKISDWTPSMTVHPHFKHGCLTTFSSFEFRQISSSSVLLLFVVILKFLSK